MMLSCKICGASESFITFLSNFRPYSDINWSFPIYECSQCGTRFALRNPLVNYHKILHSTLGGGYEEHYRIAEHVKYYLSHGDLKGCEYYLGKTAYKYSEVIKFIKNKNKKAKILEAGCSTGFITAFFRSLGYDIEGVDLSESAVSYAKSTFGPFYYTYPNKDKKYDIIIHLGLIGCVDNPKEFLLNYLELLKPNGEMFFNAPNVNSPKQLGELWVSTPPPDLVYLFSEKSFQCMLKDSFDVRSIKITKVTNKKELVQKNIKKIVYKCYNIYPKIFYQNPKICNDKKLLIKKTFSAISIVCYYIFYPFLKKYDDEYGLFITIIK